MDDKIRIFGEIVHIQQSTEIESELFKVSGECSDEVVLLFDDGNKLYVSENFLGYASPVFKAMFKHEFKEQETRQVTMTEKSFDDFQEFLLCLHPDKQKSIDNKNVLRMVSLAEEYQMEGFVTRCQEVMKKWLDYETESAEGSSNIFTKATHTKICLEILSKAIAYCYKDLITHAIKMLATLNYGLFTGLGDQTNQPVQGFVSGVQHQALFQNTTHRYGFQSFGQLSEQVKIDPNEDCKRLFESLPEEIKTQLLLERLKLLDN